MKHHGLFSSALDTNSVFISSAISCFKIKHGEVEECAAVSQVLEGDYLVGAEWLADQQVLCIVTRNGLVYHYEEGHEELEQVASLCPNLETVSWSGDQEVAAAVAAGPSLLLFIAGGQTITQGPVFSEQFGEMEPVTVGWGRKETQFHGSAGKAAARAPAAPADTSSDAGDDGLPRVSWRGDGQMLAVGAVSPATGGRRFVVFSRSGQRLSTSEPAPGLGVALAWRPSGALLATTQRLPRRLQVSFFEKNGLRHGEFTLPLPPEHAVVRQLLWSPDSAVLAVWLQLGEQHRLQLWTSGNYHWYCKRELRLEGARRPRALAWHPDRDCSLLVATSGGRLRTLSFGWTPSCGGGATAAVVDGVRVLVTPLAEVVVPPPLSAHQLELPAAVNAVCQSPPADLQPWLLAVTSDQQLHAFRQLPLGQAPSPASVEAAAAVGCRVLATAGAGPAAEFAVRAPLHQWCGSCQLPAAAADGWAWQLVSADRLACGVDGEEGPRLLLLELQLPETEGAGLRVTESASIALESPMVSMAGSWDAAAAVHTEDGALLRLDATRNTLEPVTDAEGDPVSLPAPAQQLSVVSSGGGRSCVVALTGQRRLYADGRELLAGCTSFVVADDFLLVTTLEHSLRCLPRAALFAAAAPAGGWAPAAARRLERGARLVTAVPGGTRVVLQMPRGNLEVVHPRPLVVTALAALIDRCQYREAYALMRRHRVSLNLLVDHAPATFAEHCPQLCRALMHQPNWLCVLISELSEEDVTVTLYSEVYLRRPAPAPWPPGGKVAAVCEMMRAAMEDLDRRRLLLPLLTTLVRHTPPRLQQALRTVRQIRGEPEVEGAVTVDAALRYLLLLVDEEELYSEALATYDFDLVLMVAERSQKDPKEYLPFLNGLRALPESERRYRVDTHLRRWSSALRHLAAAGADHHQQVLRLITEHSLYRTGLQLYPPGSAQHRAVCGLFADHLSEQGRSWEAAAFYQRAGAQTSAVDALRRAAAWRECLHTAGEAGMPREQLQQLAASLAADLRAAGRCAEAAEIHERHLRQPDQQVACLLEGRLWSAASAACRQARKPQLVELQVLPAVERAAADAELTVARVSEQLQQRSSRLTAVREQQRQLRERRGLLTDGEVNGADCDLYSDTSSVSNLTGSSAGSSRTHQSSKSRRKQERKRYTLREGSATEDLALVAACHALVAEAYALTDDVGSLLRALVLHQRDAAAARLQAALAALLDSLPAIVALVWPPAAAPGADQTANSVLSLLRGAGSAGAPDRMELLEPHLRYPPPARKDDSWRLLCLQAAAEAADAAADRPDSGAGEPSH